MNDYYKEREIEISLLQHSYLPGTRIQFVSSENNKHNLQPGEKGTVDIVDNAGQIFVCWDSGVNSVLMPDKDEFKRLCVDDQILEAEAIKNEQIAQKHRKRERGRFEDRNNKGYDEQSKYGENERTR